MTREDDNDTWSTLIVLHGRVEQRLADALQRGHSLGLSEYRALCHLAISADGRLRMQELADRTGLDQSSVSRLVHRLEKAGFARRSHSDHDRRCVYAAITKAGRERRDDARPTYLAALSQTLDEHATDEKLSGAVERLRAR